MNPASRPPLNYSSTLPSASIAALASRCAPRIRSTPPMTYPKTKRHLLSATPPTSKIKAEFGSAEKLYGTAVASLPKERYRDPRTNAKEKGREIFAAFSYSAQRLRKSLLKVNGFAARVQRAVDLHFLAFEFLDFVLVVDVIGVSRSGILEDILVARLHNRSGKALRSASGGRVCRRLATLLGHLTRRRILLRGRLLRLRSGLRFSGGRRLRVRVWHRLLRARRLRRGG